MVRIDIGGGMGAERLEKKWMTKQELKRTYSATYQAPTTFEHVVPCDSPTLKPFLCLDKEMQFLTSGGTSESRRIANEQQPENECYERKTRNWHWEKDSEEMEPK